MKQKRKKLGRKLFSFLLTLAMVVGLMPGMSLTAYAAQTESLLITINSEGHGERTGDRFIRGSRTFDNIATITFSAEVSNDDDNDGWYNIAESNIILSVTPTTGYTITKVKFYCKSGSAFDETSPFEATLYDYKMYVNGSSYGANGVNKIEVYGYANKTAQTISASDVTAIYGDTDKSVSASVTTPATGGGAISYTVKEGSGDYISVASDGKLTIKKVPPTDGKAYVIVTAAATDDYAETTKEVTVNISTKVMTVSASDVTATANGQPHGITVNVTDPATGYTVKYGTEEGSYTLDASPTQTEVGEKTVYYQVTADNYTTYTGSAKVTVSAKQAQTITAENVTAAYGDTGKSIEASTSGDGTLSYAVKSGDAVTVNETTGALTIVKAGSAVITVTASETATYTQATKEVTVTINKANAVAATVTANNRTYDGTAQPLVTVTGEPTGGTMQYALGTATEATEQYTTSIPSKTEAGTYYVWYKAEGSGNYHDSAPAFVTVSIKEEDDFQNKGTTDEKVEQHADTPETTVSGVSDELTNEVATPAEKTAVESGAKATFTFELTNADSTVPAAEKQLLENVVRTEAPNAVIGMLLDLKAFFQVGNMPKRQLDTLNGKTVTFNFRVPEKLHAPTGIKRTFFILQNHGGKISILARTTATNRPFSAGDFSTYALAYSDEKTDKEGFNTSIKIKQSEGKIKVSWDKVNGVAKVKVYATYCGKDYPSKPVKTTKGNSVTIKKLNGKKLNLKKNFKLYLVAYDKDGNEIGKTPSAHFAGKNSDKYTNPKSINVSSKNVSVTVGTNVKITATIKLEDKKRKELPKKHTEKFRYRSTKNYIATVDKKGNIKGIAPGTCTVYVYAKNGLAKKVTVTVN